ncbi:MAG: segregation/condensation protein A [Actinomycetota bacterium]|nr:segregation/condensation protein A [Actinomycetota bacterium]
MASAYHVAAGTFEGPFDLLLHLIARHKVDIYEVALAQITDDYLTVVREMGELNLEVATEFLVVAATLMELKAARLLPDEDDPELEELALESRDLLYARLLDYRAFKEAGQVLGQLLHASAGYLPREVSLEQRYTHLRPAVELSVTPAALAELAARALAQPRPAVDVSHLQPVWMTVREAAVMVVEELAGAGRRATFRDLTARCRSRVEVIACFLAVLELYRLEQVDLDQTESFGALTVTASASDMAEGGWAQTAFTALHGIVEGDLQPGEQVTVGD